MGAPWWNLPGPAAFVQGIVEAWHRGQHTVVCLPLGVYPGLRKASREALEDQRRLHWSGHISAEDVGRSPRDYLQHELAPNTVHGAAGDLLAGSLAKGGVLWVDGINHSSWPAWRRFMVELEAASRGLEPAERTIVAVAIEGLAVNEHPPSDVCLEVACWSGVVDSVDALIFASGLCRDSRRTDDDRFLRSLTVANLALWDGQAAEMLAGLRNEELLSPQGPLREYAESVGWAHAAPTERWEDGSCHSWHGRPVPHTAWLAQAGRLRELQRRHWKGQAQALLPFVEEERALIIERTRRHLVVPYTPSDGNTIHDCEQLEIGHLYSQIGQRFSVDANIRRKIRVLRDIRNALAHLEPVPVELIFDRALQGRFGRD